MNVGYTPERAHDLAGRLQRAAGELDAARAVVERSRRVASCPSGAEIEHLVTALREYDRRRDGDEPSDELSAA